jgi:hypothetical protein
VRPSAAGELWRSRGAANRPLLGAALHTLPYRLGPCGPGEAIKPCRRKACKQPTVCQAPSKSRWCLQQMLMPALPCYRLVVPGVPDLAAAWAVYVRRGTMTLLNRFRRAKTYTRSPVGTPGLCASSVAAEVQQRALKPMQAVLFDYLLQATPSKLLLRVYVIIPVCQDGRRQRH